MRTHASIPEPIKAGIDRATGGEIRAYLQGASRDGTFNRLHNTLRIGQADVRWLRVLQMLLERLGKRSWMYREGAWNVWVIETTWRPESPEVVQTRGEATAFVRGYFDAEGGVPADARDLLESLGVQCGRVHNPSVLRDPGYWRFYVRAASYWQFIQTVGSWHPRKRTLLGERVVLPDVVCRAR